MHIKKNQMNDETDKFNVFDENGLNCNQYSEILINYILNQSDEHEADDFLLGMHFQI